MESLRQNLRKWAAGLVILLIVVTFALWGVGDYLRGSRNPVVATVNGQDISTQEFQIALRRDQANYRQLMGDAYDARLFEDPGVRRLLLQRLIDQRLLLQDALRQGFRVSPAEVARVIKTNPLFNSDGAFQKARYLQLVNQQGMSISAFEQQLRQTMVTDQLRIGVSASALVTDGELQHLLALQGQQREAKILLLDGGDLPGVGEPTDEAIKTYYAEHPQDFYTVEMVSVAYLELALDDFASHEAVDEAALRAEYDRNKEAYTTPARRHLRHILLALPPKADDKTREQVRQRAEALRAQLDAGAAFETLAAEASEDTTTAKKGGDLGWVKKGEMDPEFEAAAFATPVGTISQPVATRFGYHLIQVLEEQPPQVTPYEQVREQLRLALQREKAREAFHKAAERLQEMTYEQPDTLEPAAEELGLTVKTSEPFTRTGGSGIAAEPAVVEQAFSEPVLQEGLNSDLIELPDDRVVVVRLARHYPAELRPLAEVRGEILNKLRERAKADQARHIGQELLTRIRAAGGDAASVASRLKELGLEWRQVRVDRLDKQLDPALLRALFAAPVADKDKVAFRGLSLPGGTYAIYAVTARHAGSVTDDVQRDQVRQQLQQWRGAAEFAAYLTALRRSADIKILAKEL